MRKINYIIISILFSFLFIILYSSLDNERVYNTKDLIGKKISQVEINLFQSNETINTKEFINNEFTILNFWASWCAPCRKEHPNLVRLSKIKNIKLVGVNFKDNMENAKSFLKENGNPFDILAEDKNGKNSVNFGVYGIPETILIDSELKILKKYIGPLNIKEVNEIRKLVKK
jgi:cytochrome c biogenesis protein CcmG/thiol:disulfide interchange protein DsbE